MTAIAIDELERWRPTLIGHCYRMLGSVTEAEDAVQNTLLRAWQQAHSFRGDSSVRTWVHTIATRQCLDMLKGARRRRWRPMDVNPEPAQVGAGLTLTQRPHEDWVEPIPDALVSHDMDPAAGALARDSIRLAFVAALQYLPARQRAALLLTDVLGWSVAEAATCLECTPAAINSALQRARATLAARNPAVTPRPLTPDQQTLLARYVDAFERYDVDRLSALLTEDATMSMPPYELWLRGRTSIARWLLGPGSECRGSRLLPASACGGMPAFAQYRHGGATPWALIVLELTGPAVADMTYFLDVDTLFSRFGFARQLAPAA